MKTVYLALGSNLGDREATLQKAIAILPSCGVEVVRVSSIYETEPMYVREQPSFLNLVLEGRTALFPIQLLNRLKMLEVELGRKRGPRNGPRVIDIDLILYERVVMETPRLVLPHPRMAERQFVLEPLAELAPDLLHPVLKKSVRELLRAVKIAPEGASRARKPETAG